DRRRSNPFVPFSETAIGGGFSSGNAADAHRLRYRRDLHLGPLPESRTADRGDGGGGLVRPASGRTGLRPAALDAAIRGEQRADRSRQAFRDVRLCEPCDPPTLPNGNTGEVQGGQNP